MYFKTNASSLTGPYLYSDVFDYGNSGKPIDSPFPLHEWAQIPLLGCLAGVVRIVLAIIHILGHLLTTICCNKGHLKHAVKGIAELFRGVIEAIPLVGNIFSCAMAGKTCCQNNRLGYFLVFVEVIVG